ncbi:MAG: DinB family protein [Acidobacteria bacterium]|nr:DinB family protein [Acidobacteriota bacterium]
MRFYGARELSRSFRTVRENTITIAEEIPEDQYDFQGAPDTRSVSQLLTHIALAIHFQHQIHALEGLTTLEGFDFQAAMQPLRSQEQQTRSRDEIIELLRGNGQKWAEWLEGLSEEFLAERVGMPQGVTPAEKSRFEMILSVKEHEMHHRGQLMLIQRMLGLVPHLTRQMQARMAQK